jgi:hypothetical protein
MVEFVVLIQQLAMRSAQITRHRRIFPIPNVASSRSWTDTRRDWPVLYRGSFLFNISKTAKYFFSRFSQVFSLILGFSVTFYLFFDFYKLCPQLL